MQLALRPRSQSYEAMSGAEIVDISATKVIHGDALNVLKSLPAGSVQLCMTSPPYNIGKSYEKGSFETFESYVDWMTEVLEDIYDCLAPSGSFCLQVGNHVSNGRVLPLDCVFIPILSDLGFVLRNRIIWRFNFGLHATRRLSGRYETLLWFTKSESEYKFNLDPIRVEQIYPGKRHSSTKADKAGQPSGNPNGKNPSDLWEFDPQDAFFGENVWDIPNVKANHPEKTTHPCQFPTELADRCILAFSDEGDLILDPFVGTGTTVICAHARRRVGIGTEIQAEYVEEAIDRLARLERGELPIRYSGKPPRRPKPGERVATKPDEWGRTVMCTCGAGEMHLGEVEIS
jgi:adenine-specific DNA-methyltransferase